MDLVIKGNSKLGSKVGIFNIPPISTCTPTEWCRNNCYARKGKHGLPNVKKGSMRRMRASKRKDFVEKMVKEVQGKWTYFRIHASGDFYSTEYVEKWIEIAKQCPDTIFMAFTKRTDLTAAIKRLSNLSNTMIRESLDKSRPNPVMGLKFAKIDHYKFNKRGMIDCKDGCEDCGYACWVKDKSVILHEH